MCTVINCVVMFALMYTVVNLYHETMAMTIDDDDGHDDDDQERAAEREKRERERERRAQHSKTLPTTVKQQSFACPNKR